MNLWQTIPPEVILTEVGPRDGLQNEPQILETSVKVHFIRLLEKAGLARIEAASFVRADRVPQMKDARQLYSQLGEARSEMMCLVPNTKGFQAASECNVQSLALLTAASDTFNKKNINATVEENLQELSSLISKAQQKGMNFRIHLSTVFGCPYEGEISTKRVIEIVERLLSMGAREIVLGDTIGAATPRQVSSLLNDLLPLLGEAYLTLHFHDTRGMAVANVLTALEMGFFSFDSSVGGLGGCPYAPGASGNVATEELVHLFDSLGIKSGVSMDSLMEAAEYIRKELGKEGMSKFSCAYKANRSRKS